MRSRTITLGLATTLLVMAFSHASAESDAQFAEPDKPKPRAEKPRTVKPKRSSDADVKPVKASSDAPAKPREPRPGPQNAAATSADAKPEKALDRPVRKPEGEAASKPGRYATEAQAASACKGAGVVWIGGDGLNHYKGTLEYGRKPGGFGCDQ